MVSNQIKLFFLVSLMLVIGGIQALPLKPTGKVSKVGDNAYQDEQGITCMCRNIDKGINYYECRNKDNSVVAEGTMMQGAHNPITTLEAWQSFNNFAKEYQKQR